MAEDTLEQKLTEIVEILHNSWLEDNYEYDDPDGLQAIKEIKLLLSKHIRDARIDELERLHSVHNTAYKANKTGLITWDGGLYTNRRLESLSQDKEEKRWR